MLLEKKKKIKAFYLAETLAPKALIFYIVIFLGKHTTLSKLFNIIFNNYYYK